MNGMLLLPVGEELYLVKRTFKVDRLQPVIDKHGTDMICKIYNCEKILKGRDAVFYLVDKVEDVEIIG